MISANAPLQALLASGWLCVTDLWQFILANGTTLFLTGGQRPLTYGGNTYLAGVAITRDKIRRALGFEVSELKVEMASSSFLIGTLTLPQAVASGVFNLAKVKLFRAYHDEFADAPAMVTPRFEGDVGVQTPGARSVVLQFKSATAKFSVQYPLTTFMPTCNNAVYDGNCGLSKAAFTEALTVGAGSSASTILCSPTSTRGQTTANFYQLGVILFTSGALAGQQRGISASSLASGVATLSLLRPFGQAPATGDAFNLTPGCPRDMATCNANFANLANYRGYPLVPNAEAII